MDFIISFFRDIDGWVYYTILVVNTILIFAIIGYLGEKNREDLIKLGMNTNVPEPSDGAINMSTPTQSSPVTTGLSIPKVAATSANVNMQPGNVTGTNQGIVNQPAQINQPVSQVASNPVNMPVNNSDVTSNNVMPVQNPVPNSNNMQSQAPVDNSVEKAPGVLIINSPNNQGGVK